MIDYPLTHTQLMVSLFMFFLMGAITSYYAHVKGKNMLLWFLLGGLFGVFALIALYFLPSEEDKSIDPVYTSNSSIQDQQPTQSALPLENDRLWYYLDRNHQQYGPVSLIALKDLWDTGTLDVNSYVWTEGMENWDKLDNLPQLKEKFKHYLG